MRRTKVTLAAKRNRASDESVEPRPGRQRKAKVRKKDAHLNSLRPMVIGEGGGAGRDRDGDTENHIAWYKYGWGEG